MLIVVLIALVVPIDDIGVTVVTAKHRVQVKAIIADLWPTHR